VHPKAKQVQNNLPEDENYYLHQEALEWHKKEVFNKFL